MTSQGMILQAKKCNNNTVGPDEPTCADMSDINNFVKYISIETWAIH